MRAAVLSAICVHLLLLTAASSVRIPPGYPDRTTSRTVDYLPVEESDWVRTQATYAAQLASRVAHDEPLDLVVFGDSITESLRGTLQGKPHANTSGVPAVWERHFGSWQAMPLGIAGDRTVNLLWRIKEGGEAPAGLHVRSAVLQIGTNDFYNHYERKFGEVPLSETDVVAEEIVMGIIASTTALHKRWPQTHLFVFDILPRGDVEPGVPNPASIHLNWPSMFTKAITQINNGLETYALSQPYVDYVACGHLYILRNPKGSQLNPELISDGLHPTPAGMDVLLECLKPHLQPPAHHRKLDLMDTA